jgi:hypothetical protein
MFGARLIEVAITTAVTLCNRIIGKAKVSVVPEGVRDMCMPGSTIYFNNSPLFRDKLWASCSMQGRELLIGFVFRLELGDIAGMVVQGRIDARFRDRSSVVPQVTIQFTDWHSGL